MFDGILDPIKGSFLYSYKNTVGNPRFWLGLILVEIVIGISSAGCLIFTAMRMFYMVIPLFIIIAVLDFFFLGLEVKILANQNLSFKGFTKTIGEGIKVLLITLIYVIGFSLILSLIMLAVGKISALGTYATGALALLNDAVSLFDMFIEGNIPSDIIDSMTSIFFPGGFTVLGFISLIIFILASLFAAIIFLTAIVNFARTGKFTAAFNFPQIIARIKKVTPLKFTIALLIFVLIYSAITFIICLIVGLIQVIPNEIVSNIITVIFTAPLLPIFYIIFPIKYIGILLSD